MANDQKRTPAAGKAVKKAAKRETHRDAPCAPNAKQIERSISRGKTLPLSDFVKGVKL